MCPYLILHKFDGVKGEMASGNSSKFSILTIFINTSTMKPIANQFVKVCV